MPFPNQPLTFSDIANAFRRVGCHRLYVKELAWNHDSKRQIYITSDLSAFNYFPCRIEDAPPMPAGMTSSKKPKAANSNRIYGHLDYCWLNINGSVERAATTKLIYYPQYPEVRLSGFMKGVKSIPPEYMKEKAGEVFENRLLFLGVNSENMTFGMLCVDHEELRNEIQHLDGYHQDSGLNQLSLLLPSGDPKESLIARLKQIHLMGWVQGQRLVQGHAQEYTGQNAVGYTLEALLGVSPNGHNEPDFEGFEVKGYTVSKFGKVFQKPVTVLTIEPDIGVYRDAGVIRFLTEWGYPDTLGRQHRQNFGGIYRMGVRHHRTKLTLKIVGFDPHKPDRIEVDGHIGFYSDDNRIAAGWTFRKLIDSWSRKHANAVYIPAMSDKINNTYWYGSPVLLGTGADLLKVLSVISEGALYLDPAIKAENWTLPNQKLHVRNQFRIKFSDVAKLYLESEQVTLSDD